MAKRIIIFISVLLPVLFCSNASAVYPVNSSNWADFRGTILHNVNNQYVSVIFDTDDNGSCTTSDLTGATEVAVSPKTSWLAGSYFLANASISLGFAMPAPSYQIRGLCLRYYSAGYYIEPEVAFFYQASSPTPTSDYLANLGDTLSSSSAVLVLNHFTVGEIVLALLLFILILFELFKVLRRHI